MDKRIEFYLGNNCRYKCRSCGPESSSAWYLDFMHVHGGSSFMDKGKTVDLMPLNRQMCLSSNDDEYYWYRNNALYERYKEDGSANEILFSGGEPLLSEEHLLFLKRLIAENRAKNISLEYTTSLDGFNPSLFEVWQKFKLVKIGVSIDGPPNVNGYIRYPLKNDKFENKLKILNEYNSSELWRWFTFTIQAYNVFYLPEYINWKLEAEYGSFNNDSSHPFMSYHFLEEPKFLSIQVLPESFKFLVADKLTRHIDTLRSCRINQEALQNHAHHIKKIINHMFKKDLSNELLNFWQFTKKLDMLRNQSFEKELPELAQAVKSTLRLRSDNI